VGAAGPKLVFPDGRIQSAGVVVGIGGVAGSLFTGMNSAFSGYLHKASLMQDLSCVTAALMIVKRSVFEEVSGFDESLAVAFNDVDLCLKIRKAGYLVVYDPFTQAVHYESMSRGDEYTKEKAQRYRREAALMKERWPGYYEEGDPYYNPNFSLERWDYVLKP
jgi:GT2 family glycosyltransferase